MQLIYKMHRVKIAFFTALVIISTSGCKNLVEVNAPVTSTNGDNVYTSDANATAVLTGMYGNISKGSFATGNAGISFFSGLSSDELTLYNGISSADKKTYYYQNALYSKTTGTDPGTDFWASMYNYIFICNAAIEGLANASPVTPAVRTQLTGEARFMRAFFYFYLANLYGDVPLSITTDYSTNAGLARSARSQVYQQIIADLKEAKTLLSDNYLNGSLQKYTGAPERLRPTKWAASALLARAYLYNGDYANAESEASTVINNTSLYRLASLDSSFLKNSTEAIWQLQPVNTGWNTEDARVFVLSSAPVGVNTTHPAYLSSYLLSAFEASDNRRLKWVTGYTDLSGTHYYPSKYKSATNGAAVTEYLMMLRLGEQYLIRGEARAQQNNIGGAQADLDSIRARAGLPIVVSSDKASLMAAILHERQVELFTEWGNRWLDLKRMGIIDAVMGSPGGVCAAKGGTWNSYQQWYPLPLYDLQKDPALVQNPGY
jgi:hypothetical protein